MDETEIKNSIEFQVYNESMSWLGQKAPIKEKIIAYQLHWPVEKINKSMMYRIVGLIVSVLVGLIFSIKFQGGMKLGIMAVGVIFGSVLWYKIHSDLINEGMRIQLRRRMSFFKFMQLLCSQLHRLEDGDSLVGILRQVSMQIDEKYDRQYIYQLISEIGPNPKNFDAYIQFAHDYGQSELAEQLMRAVFAMNEGAFDRTTTNSIAAQVNANITKQSENIMEFKNKRFNPVYTKLTMVSLLIIVGDFITLLLSILSSLNLNG